MCAHEEPLNTNLSANSVRGRPQCIIFFCNFTVINNPLQFLHYTLVHISLRINYNKNSAMYITSHNSSNEITYKVTNPKYSKRLPQKNLILIPKYKMGENHSSLRFY